ncbi:MAG: hypothetical protein RLZ92_2053, partial [Pseudomonadota bacterium]
HNDFIVLIILKPSLINQKTSHNKENTLFKDTIDKSTIKKQ